MKKEKIKKVLKNRIFIFVMSAILFSVVGVSAATYFESGAVTYDNTESGLTSTNVQGAIDELYNACKTPSTPAGNYILENVPIITVGEGLHEDEFQSARYIFKGGNPNNYITFNGEDAGWRIISIEPDKTIKIRKIDNIGDQMWNTTSSSNWEFASLNTYLNNTYYNSLTDTAKKQIVAKDWSIGKIRDENNYIDDQVSMENSDKWTGKIALPTVSEYIRSNSNESWCGTFSLINNNYSNCLSTGWMDNNESWWTLSPLNGYSSMVFFVSYSEYDGITYEYYDSTELLLQVHPALYLSSDIKLSGSGTESDPYVIE